MLLWIRGLSIVIRSENVLYESTQKFNAPVKEKEKKKSSSTMENKVGYKSYVSI